MVFWLRFIVCHVYRLMRWRKRETATLRHECNRRDGRVALQVRYLAMFSAGRRDAISSINRNTTDAVRWLLLGCVPVYRLTPAMA